MIAGMGSSFVVIGVALSALPIAATIGPDSLRIGASILMLSCGAVLVSERGSHFISGVFAPLSVQGDRILRGVPLDGLLGQFVVGSLLGLIWSPCTGPALGAAVSMAAQPAMLPHAVLIFGAFALGTSVPLLAFAYGARGWMSRNRAELVSAGSVGKRALGWGLLVVGGATLSGTDKILEAAMLHWLPSSVTDLISRF